MTITKITKGTPSDTVDMSHKREDLVVEKVGNVFIIADAEDGSVLCWGSRLSYDLHIYQPIHWTDYAKAEEWVKDGCIGQLQESWTHLDIGFRKNHVRKRESTYTETLKAEGAKEQDEALKFEEKKEFVVVEKLLEEHKVQKNKIFIWLEHGTEGIHVQCYHKDAITTLASISEKGMRLFNNCSYSGITVERDNFNKIKLIS